MKSLPSHQRLLIFLLLALALTCVISPWLALGADWAWTRWPDAFGERIAFSRVFNRAFMVAGFFLFFICRHYLFGAELKDLLIVDRRCASRNLLTGLGLAVGSMIGLLSAMTLADVYTPFFRLSLADSLSRFSSAVLSGVFAGALEEFFFRGLLFRGLLQGGRVLRAYLLANLFYAVLHFVKPGERYFLEGIDPLAGFKHLATTFLPFLDPVELLPGIFGLFSIGAVLSFALARTGNLYLSIGLHAGWVLSLKSVRIVGDFKRHDLGWLFGSTDPKIVSGVATWIGVFLVGCAVHLFTRRSAGGAGDRPHESAA